ncbi:unnamed protein product [Diamesa hyperborea]
MEKRGDGSSTGSSKSEIYKNMMKSPTPICMFYFSHPFGISSPSSTTPNDNVKSKKSSKYTTTTYLVTEIQKNHTDELLEEPKNTKEVFFDDRVLTPWPKSFLLPPLLQLLERKHAKNLPDIEAILEQVRGQAWHTPKSYQSHRFWSRESSTVSSVDLSSFTIPEITVNADGNKSNKIKHKVKSKVKKEENSVKMDSSNYSTGSSNSGTNNKLLKRRYSVPEIIMRKYSLAQQKSYEESIEVYSSTHGATTAATNNNNNNNKCNKTSLNGQQQIQSTSPNTTISSPVKYFIPFTSSSHSDVNVSPTGGCGSNGGIGEYSMRKQTLLRRMWSREWQHTKYSGSWSPPLRRSTQHSQRRLNKFNTLPEFELQSACEKCKQLGVSPRNSFDEDLIDQKEDKGQQTDMAPVLNQSPKRLRLESSKTFSSNSSSASTIINSAEAIEEVTLEDIKDDLLSTKDTDNLDNNGNNVLIYMTSSHGEGGKGCGGVPRENITKDDSEDVLHVEIDNNNNNDDKLFRKLIERESSNEADIEEDYENGNLTLNGGTSSFNYKRLREENMSDLELDQFISQLLIENLNNVIKSVNENLQAQGEHNLVKIIDYQPTVQHLRNGQEVDDDGYNNNNKLPNQKQQHENYMRNAKNGDNKNINRLNSNEPPLVNCLVGENQYANADVNYQELEDAEELEKRRLNNLRYGEDRSRSETSNSIYSTDAEIPTGPIQALINTGSTYPGSESNGTVFVPRITAPRTESMEVQPSSSSANEDEELDGGFPDSDDDTISLVDSLDDVVTIRASKLTLLGQHQQKKAKFIFRQTHHKGQAFFVPIFNAEKMDPQMMPDTLPEIPCIEMPRQLKEKLILRQRRRDMKRQNENKVKQWRMQKFIERKMGEVNLIQGYEMDDFTSGGSSFKVIALPTTNNIKKTNIVKKESGAGSKSKSNSSGGGGGWTAKTRSVPSNSSNSSKNNKSKKLRNEIGMLESYKIDGRGNMQIQAPGKPEPIVNPPPVVKISKPTSKKPIVVSEPKKPIVTKSKTPAPESVSSAKSKASSKRSTVPPSSASSIEAKSAMEARRKQVMKDVQQMSVYKNDLTPDPESGPMRKMWKTEIQEGDKRIEILEIVECPSQFVDVNSSDHHHNHLLPLLTSHNHKYQHLSSSAPQTTIVNKTFSVRTTGYTNGAKSARYQKTSSKIPIPVYHRSKSSNRFPGMRDSRDNSPTNRYSSSTDVESLTSAGSSTAQHQTGSKVDRMIADLLMEALKSPEDLGIDFVKSPKTKTSKRKAIHSPAILGTESSSTGYGTGDSSSRRSASNSANNKYLQRFEVIPEEKSSFSVESSNDDLDGEDDDDDEDEDEENQEPLTPTRDWKSQKNLDNHDIKIKRTSSFTKSPPAPKKVEKKTPPIVTPTVKKKPAIIIKSKAPLAPVKPLVEDKKNIIKKSPSRAREAVENDNPEPKAWIGFSQQCDHSSSLDENTGDEELKDNENSHKIHEKTNRNISSSKSEAPTTTTTNSSTDPRHQNNCCFLSSSGSENILTVIDKRNKFDPDLSAGKESTTPGTSEHKEVPPHSKENIIKIDIEDTNKDASDCSCTKKYLPYQVNEKNVWQVYETSDCKYIQTRYEVFETYQPPEEEESIPGTAPENPYKLQTDDGLLHSRSNFSNQIICHSINHETNHLKTPTQFKEAQPPQTRCSSNCCYCDPNNKDLDCQFCVNKTPLINYIEDTTVPSTAQSNQTEIIKSDYRPLSSIKFDPPMIAITEPLAITNNKSPAKLLNRPKEINNLPRDRKSVKKEVKNEIKNHSIKVEVNNKNKTVKLPSPSQNQNQGYFSPLKKKSYNESNEDYSSISSSCASPKSTPKKVLNRRKNSKDHVKSSDKESRNNNESCIKSDNGGLVLPPANQGWSVTVAGNYHPEMTPDVEMKLSFNKNKMDIQKKNIDMENYLTRNQEPIQTQHKEEVYFYNNRNIDHQILPAAPISQNQYHTKPFINQRRSLSLARVDTGLPKQKSYHLPNLNIPQSRTARTTGRKSIKQVECTISKTVSHLPNKRSLSLDMGNSSRRTSFDHSQMSAMNTPSDMCLSVVGSEIKKRHKPKVMTMSEKDLTRRHYSCFTRNS